MERFSERIAQALKLPVHRVENTLKLLEGGATIPFISRYRKEATGGMDEVQIGEIQARNEKLGELAKRKETVLTTIEGLGKLTPELRARIDACWDATELEDIYLPYKPKRKTRAEMARQKGLEPLAALLLMQRENHLEAKVRAFVKGDVKDEDDALRGARDIIAEQVSEDEQTRNVHYTNKDIIEENILDAFPSAYSPPVRPSRRAATGGGQVLSQSDEPMFREPEHQVRTD